MVHHLNNHQSLNYATWLSHPSIYLFAFHFVSLCLIVSAFSHWFLLVMSPKIHHHLISVINLLFLICFSKDCPVNCSAQPCYSSHFPKKIRLEISHGESRLELQMKIFIHHEFWVVDSWMFWLRIHECFGCGFIMSFGCGFITVLVVDSGMFWLWI